jgi:hypothetical protein
MTQLNGYPMTERYYVFDNMNNVAEDATVKDVVNFLPECWREMAEQILLDYPRENYTMAHYNCCPVETTSCQHGVGNGYRVYVEYITLK